MAGPILWGPNNTSSNLQGNLTQAGRYIGAGVAAPWTTGTAYVAGDVVWYGINEYLCLTGNTAGSTFEADFASGYWKLVNLPAVAKNYMGVGSNFENNTVGGWQLFNVTLTNLIPSAAPTLGSATGLSVAATSTTPIGGKYSLAAGNTASTNIAAGSGIISQAYTIDSEDQARSLAFRFYYSAVANLSTALMNFSGTSSNTWAVYIYDVTNSAWIQPAGVYNLIQATGSGICSGTWQTPSNMTQFRIAVVCINATTGTTPAANAYQMYFDDFYCGPQPFSVGGSIGDWQTFTMVITGSTTNPTKGTTSIDKAYWRRVGDSMQIRYEYNQTAAGSAGSGTYYFTIPSGYAIDGNKITIGTSPERSSIGAGQAYDGTNVRNIELSAATSTGLELQDTSGGIISSTNFQLSNGTLRYGWFAQVPIVGWSSNTVQSADTDTRVVACQVNGQPTGTIASTFASSTTTVYPTVTSDTHGAYSSGTYTVPIAGYYRVTASVQISCVSTAAGSYAGLEIYQNGSPYRYNQQWIGSSTITAPAPTVTATVKCNAGDTLTIRPSCNGTTPTYGTDTNLNYLNIERLSGPAVIQATDTVAAKYWASANQTVTSSAPFNFDSKAYDTTGSVTTGAAWKFTAPVSGKYLVTVYASNSTSISTQAINLYKNGSVLETFGYLYVATPALSQTVAVELLAGDYIDVRTSGSYPSAGAAGRSSGASFIQIERMGN